MPVKPLLLAGALVSCSALTIPARAAETLAADLFAARSPDAPAMPAGSPSPAAAAFVLEPAALPPAKGGTPRTASGIDLAALRYYAGENDLGRVAAEIRLLRSQHPGWEPPQDLFSDAGATVDEQPLWALFAKHDLSALRAAMDDLRKGTPGWQPSADLATKLRLAEAHDALVAASDAKRWPEVIGIAEDTRGLLRCGDVDALWRTAEALKQVGDEPRAVAAYRYILADCEDRAERLATVQKAAAVLTMPGAVDGLMALGRTGSDGRGEFESLRYDPLRVRVGQAAAGKPGADVSATDLADLARIAETTGSVSDAQLLGWYHYARKAPTEAERWFRAALAITPTAKAAEGLVLALRDQNRLIEALDLSMAHRDAAPDNRKAFREIMSGLLVASTPAAVPEPEQVTAFKAAVETDKDAVGAQSFGWWLMKAKRPAEAEGWFQKSLAWQQTPEAAVGALLAARQLGHAKAAADVVSTYRARFPQVAELEAALRARAARPARVAVRAVRGSTPKRRTDGGWDNGATAIVDTFQAGRYDDALALMDARRATKAEPHGLAIVRGWAQYKRGDWAAAEQTFGALAKTGTAPDAEHGLRVIQQGYLPPQLR